MWVWSLNKSAVSLINESIHFTHYFINKLSKGKHSTHYLGQPQDIPWQDQVKRMLQVHHSFTITFPLNCCPDYLDRQRHIHKLITYLFILTRVRAVETDHMSLMSDLLNSAIEQKGLTLSHSFIRILHFQPWEDLTLLGKSLNTVMGNPSGFSQPETPAVAVQATNTVKLGRL